MTASNGGYFIRTSFLPYIPTHPLLLTTTQGGSEVRVNSNPNPSPSPSPSPDAHAREGKAPRLILHTLPSLPSLPPCRPASTPLPDDRGSAFHGEDRRSSGPFPRNCETGPRSAGDDGEERPRISLTRHATPQIAHKRSQNMLFIPAHAILSSAIVRTYHSCTSILHDPDARPSTRPTQTPRPPAPHPPPHTRPTAPAAPRPRPAASSPSPSAAPPPAKTPPHPAPTSACPCASYASRTRRGTAPHSRSSPHWAP